jgi:hypothetical protein
MLRSARPPRLASECSQRESVVRAQHRRAPTPGPKPQHLGRSVSDIARTRALAAYKDFLALWKDADAGLPTLQQAKSEYARLQ